jgi:hypothetical protein
MRWIRALFLLCCSLLYGSPASEPSARRRPRITPPAWMFCAGVGGVLFQGLVDLFHGHLSVNGFVVLTLLVSCVVVLVAGRQR